MMKAMLSLLVLLAISGQVFGGGLPGRLSLTAEAPPVKGPARLLSGVPRALPPGILSGGPDDFGYLWSTSRDSGGPVYNWVEIRAIGRPATWAIGDGDDGNTGLLPLSLKGLGFSFYGASFDRIAICSNGWLSFTDSSRVDFSPPPSLPDAGAPLALAAPLFTDLDARTPSPGIFYYSDTTGSNNRFIVEWDSVYPLGQSTPVTFEAILDAGDSSILFQYRSSSAGWALGQVSGIQNQAGAIGLTQRDSLGDALAVRFHRTFLAHDVAAFRIDNPGANVLPASPLLPRVLVANLGASTESFNATLQVDSAGVPVYQQTQAVSTLAPGAQKMVHFTPSWTPGPRGAPYQATAYTTLSGDLNPGNDTTRSAQTTTDTFGAVLNTFAFPQLGPFSLAGICYCPRDGFFYLTSMNDDAVYKFHPDTFELRFAFHTLNPAGELPWGIACVDTFFWVGQVGSNGLGTINYKYTYHGAFANDTMDMVARMRGTTTWAAGLDWDGTYLRQISVETQPTSRIFSINLQQRTVVTWLQNPIWGATSQRACAFLVPGTPIGRLITGGWNQNTLYKIADTTGTIVQLSGLSSLADAKAYPSSLPLSLWGVATLSDAPNTLVRIALAESYVTGVEEERPSPPNISSFALGPASPNPMRERTVIPVFSHASGPGPEAPLAVYDALGRLVRVLSLCSSPLSPHAFVWDGRDNRGRQVPAGVYFYGSSSGSAATGKLVLVR
jgi:hypothetical protein